MTTNKMSHKCHRNCLRLSYFGNDWHNGILILTSGKNGSSGRTRTYNLVVNSHPLCLSDNQVTEIKIDFSPCHTGVTDSVDLRWNYGIGVERKTFNFQGKIQYAQQDSNLRPSNPKSRYPRAFLTHSAVIGSWNTRIILFSFRFLYRNSWGFIQALFSRISIWDSLVKMLVLLEGTHQIPAPKGFLNGVASQYELANVFSLTFIAEHIIFNVS